MSLQAQNGGPGVIGGKPSGPAPPQKRSMGTVGTGAAAAAGMSEPGALGSSRLSIDSKDVDAAAAAQDASAHAASIGGADAMASVPAPGADTGADRQVGTAAGAGAAGALAMTSPAASLQLLQASAS